MSALEFLQFYFSWNFFFAVMGLLLFFYGCLENVFSFRPQARKALSFLYLIILSFAVFWLFVILSPQNEHSVSLLQVLRSQKTGEMALTLNPFFHPIKNIQVTGFVEESFEILSGGVFLLFFLSLYFHLKSFLGLGHFFKNTLHLRNIKNVKIYFSEQMSEPFSFWNLRSLCIFIPSYMASDAKACRVVLAHELQHHRQGDTRWVYFFTFLKVFCFWNPLLHYALKKISEYQEFACDEVLVDRKHVPPRAYAGYLLRVAEEASLALPACTTGFLKERSLLKRRIEKMIKRNVHSRVATSVFASLLSLSFFAAAWGAKGLLQDKQLSLKQAQSIAKGVESETFPLPVNEQVLEALNFYVGTEEGREKMKKSLERMEAYRGLVEKKLQDYGVPEELIVIPIVESGYQNLAPRNSTGWGAGLWMFIRGTARNYGLKVNDSVDERLNEELLTDAAMRYLVANWMRFKSWHLSTLAYNGGEGQLQKLIDQTSSRDPWTLVSAGAESDKGYLSKILAAAIILKNPQLVE